MEPTHWIVHFGAQREYFANRSKARMFAALQKLAGHAVRIEARGF